MHMRYARRSAKETDLDLLVCRFCFQVFGSANLGEHGSLLPLGPSILSLEFLAALARRVLEQIDKRRVVGIGLINNDDGQQMTKYMLRYAFEAARAKAAADNPGIAKDIMNFQFRDLRAKAGTDKEEISGIEAAQAQLGHTTTAMTARYVRHRRGKLVKPTK